MLAYGQGRNSFSFDYDSYGEFGKVPGEVGASSSRIAGYLTQPGYERQTDMAMRGVDVRAFSPQVIASAIARGDYDTLKTLTPEFARIAGGSVEGGLKLQQTAMGRALALQATRTQSAIGQAHLSGGQAQLGLMAANGASGYGIKKVAIEAYLSGQARASGFPATILHPGHIVGQGWHPINPAGNVSLSVWQTISRGEPLDLPNFGLETLHHVHADDVATLFMAAIANWSTSVGQSFHSVSDKALTLRGYAEAMYQWFGHEPNLRFAPFDEWAKGTDTKDARTTWDHIARSPNCSMDKAARLLGYRPRYTSLEAVQESVRWIMDRGELK